VPETMGRANVLVVDDDPYVRETLSEILRSILGFDTDSASDGLRGLSEVRSKQYDMIFTDLKMPRLGGIDFMKEVKRLYPSLPVVVITGFATVDNAISAMKEGAHDFVTKPFRVDKVKLITDRILEEIRLLRECAENNRTEASLARLNAELCKKLHEINLIQVVGNELDRLNGNGEVYERIVEMASRLLMVTEASFGIVENGSLKIVNAVGTTRRELPIAGSLFEKVIQKGDFCIASFGEINPHSGKLLTCEFLSIPFSMRDEVYGILNLSNKIDETAFTESDIDLAITLTKKVALRIENNALYEVFYTTLMNTLKSLVITIEARDSYTLKHSERVTAYALEIAEALDVAPEEMEALRFGGYLHDMGKIGVRDAVLMKRDRLTDEEMAEIRLHPVIGDDILKPIRFFPKERELIRHHHERFDGRGYPDGLTGEEIPFTARILAVADTYDAVTSDRPYRPARSHGFAIEEIMRCAGGQFDRQVVSAFMGTRTGQGGKNGG